MLEKTSTFHMSESLSEYGAPWPLVRVVTAIAEACHQISVDLRTDTVHSTKSSNNFGDEVLSVDLMAERHISGQLRCCRAVAAYVSEERPTLTRTEHDEGAYSVSYDPLDGSSIIRTNFAVGSIFAVWPGDRLIGLRVRDMVASIVAVYGPRTVFFVAMRSAGVMEFYWNGDRWHRAVPAGPRRIKSRATVFAPGNLRAAARLSWYRALLQGYLRAETTLRYTGGMVPDVCQIIVKGDGIYMTPESPGHKIKLRLLFEAAPMAFLIDCAGGRATTGLMDMMDVEIVEIDQRTAIALGCRWDVEQYERLCRAGSKI